MRYALREVEAMLGLSRTVIRRLMDAGFVRPEQIRRGEYRFTFQDLALLRTAKTLTEAHLPMRKIVRSLQRIREALPPEVPLSGLRVASVGNEIVVQAADAQWQADSGQLLLDFELTPRGGRVAVFDRARGATAATAHEWFCRACALEESDPNAAEDAYRQAVRIEPGYTDAYLNLGCQLSEAGRHAEAVEIYRLGLGYRPDESLLHFNLGTALEELGQDEEALRCYEGAIRADPAFADAHYNAARLHEQMGREREAIRHYSAYRRIVSR